MTFSEKVKRLIAEHAKSATSVAKGNGIKPSTLLNVVNFNRTPQVDTALAIARAFNVSLEWLADDARNWPPPAQPAELGQVERLLKPENDADLQRLSDEFGGLAVCVVAGIEVLLSLPEDAKELALSRVERRRRNAGGSAAKS